MSKTRKYKIGGYSKIHDLHIFNILSSSILIIFALPFFLIITILIKLVDKGPVLYRGKRLGYNKNIFIIYKFRTLIPSSENKIGAKLLTSEEDNLITPVGKFLRDTKLDELPQLFNILKGEMNFIGPRPERPLIYDKICKHIKNYDRRFLVKPGLIGYSQLFTPHNTPKRLRSMIDNAHLREKRIFLWDIYTVLCTSVTVIFTIFWKLTLVVGRLPRTYVLRDQKRASERAKPRAAKVFAGSIVDGKEMFTIEAKLVNINANAFLINTNNKIDHNFSVFKLQRIVPGFRLKCGRRKTKTAYCYGKIIRATETKGEKYKYLYVIEYTPISPFNFYIIHQYFLLESFVY